MDFDPMTINADEVWEYYHVPSRQKFYYTITGNTHWWVTVHGTRSLKGQNERWRMEGKENDHTHQYRLLFTRDSRLKVSDGL